MKTACSKWLRALIKLVPLIFVCFFHLNSIAQTLEIPIIKSVTVDHTLKKVIIKWSINNPLNIDGFSIRRIIFESPDVVEGTTNTIENINDRFITTYTDISNSYKTFSKPYERVEYYYVTSFKGSELSTMGTMHATMFLKPVTFDRCKKSVKLMWSKYQGWNAIKEYKILESKSLAETPRVVAVLNATDTIYEVQNVTLNENLIYHVQAVELNGSEISNSNHQEIFTQIPPSPLFINADYASVSGAYVDLSFTIDPLFLNNRCKLIRKLNGKLIFDTIVSKTITTNQFTYRDTIQVNEEIAYYKLLTLNECNQQTQISNLASNMVLKAWKDNSNSNLNQMEWNEYAQWIANVDQYEIYRKIDEGAFEKIGYALSGITTYTDDLSTILISNPSIAKVSYQIKAIENSGNIHLIQGVSISNVSEVLQDTKIYFPNAFNPNSNFEENRVFKPLITNSSEYLLIIYNRWGNRIFETKNASEGWTGLTSGGKIEKSGTYIYLLKITTIDGKNLQYKGMVNLVY